MRRSLVAMAITFGFVLACTGEEAEEATTEAEPKEAAPAPAPEPAPPPHGPRGGGAPQFYACCNVPNVQNLMQEYLDLTQLLATKPDEDSASAECYALEGAANAMSKDAAVKPVDQKAAADLAAIVDRVKGGTVGQIRAELPAITSLVGQVTRSYPGGEVQVAEAECVGSGSWLQVGAVLSSPYGAAEGKAGKAGKRPGGVGGVCSWK